MGLLSVKNLGKAYKYYSSNWQRFIEWFVPFSGSRHSLKWILRNINFELMPGDAMGIIGINGAGKSTLLKMIVGTILPSQGEVKIQGRVAAMLELGMGFHPDFTGRQNVYNAGQLLGLHYKEISSLMPEIEAFAEIGEYIDQPVRIYSSGMQVRLAFSVATAVRPDLLIIDEALSVGDIYFQHKSFERIRQYNAMGTTLLIVSHDRHAIQSICNRAMLIDHGQAAMQGTPEEVMDYYNARIALDSSEKVSLNSLARGKLQSLSGNRDAEVVLIELLNKDHQVLKIFEVAEPVTLVFHIKINRTISNLVIGYVIKDRLGQPIYGTNTFHLKSPIKNLKSGDEIKCDFFFPLNLGPGEYSIATALTAGETHFEGNFEWRDLAHFFTVMNTKYATFLGTSFMDPKFKFSIQGACDV